MNPGVESRVAKPRRWDRVSPPIQADGAGDNRHDEIANIRIASGVSRTCSRVPAFSEHLEREANAAKAP
jgi:hypothetical protein